MSLSACGGANQTANDYFQEDTLLHEDIFGSVESAIESKAFRNLDPVGRAVPLIGVQQQTYTDSRDSKQYLAVRFVAVVNLPDLSTTIKWNRGIYEDDGDCHKAFAEPLVATTVYESIYDGSSQVYISSYEGYTHFATYTVRKIPTDKTGYFIKASIIVGETAYDKVYATSVDLTKKVSFAPSTLTKDYFLCGKLNGSATPAVLEQEDTTRKQDAEGTYLASFAPDLKAEDNFVVVWNDNDNNKFKIFNPTLDGTTSTTNFTNTNGNISVGANNHYALYLTDDNKLQSDVEYLITLKLIKDDASSTLYARGTFNGWGTSNPLYATGNSGEYFVTLRLIAGSYKFKFCEGESGYETGYDRNLVADQDMSISYSFNVEAYYRYYLVGTVKGDTNWNDLPTQYLLTPARIETTDFYQINLDLYESDQFKVRGIGDRGTWTGYIGYGSTGNDYSLGSNVNCTIYYNPSWDGFDVRSDYYVRGDFNNWEQQEEYKLTQTGFSTYVINNVEIGAGQGFKVASTTGIWYAESSTEGGADNVLPGAGVYNITLDVNKTGGTFITYTPVN